MSCSSFPFFPQEAKQKHRVKADKVRQNTPRPLRSLYFVCVRLMHLLLAVQPEIRIWRQSSGMIVIERYWILQLKVPARALVPVKKARYGACAGAEYHLSLSFVVWRRHHSCSVASAPSSRSQKRGAGNPGVRQAQQLSVYPAPGLKNSIPSEFQNRIHSCVSGPRGGSASSRACCRRASPSLLMASRPCRRPRRQVVRPCSRAVIVLRSRTWPCSFLRRTRRLLERQLEIAS